MEFAADKSMDDLSKQLKNILYNPPHPVILRDYEITQLELSLGFPADFWARHKDGVTIHTVVEEAIRIGFMRGRDSIKKEIRELLGVKS